MIRELVRLWRNRHKSVRLPRNTQTGPPVRWPVTFDKEDARKARIEIQEGVLEELTREDRLEADRDLVTGATIRLEDEAMGKQVKATLREQL